MFWLTDSAFYERCVFFSNVYNKIFLIEGEYLLLKRIVPIFHENNGLMPNCDFWEELHSFCRHVIETILIQSLSMSEYHDSKAYNCSKMQHNLSWSTLYYI